jgi:hypothetical protein
MAQQLQQLINLLRSLITAKQPRVFANARLVPLAQHIDDMCSKDSLAAPSKGGDIVIPQALNLGNDALEREADFDEQVWDPSAWTDVVLEFNGVLLDHGDEEGGREGGFGEGEAVGHVAHHVDDCFVRLLGAVVAEGFLVGGVDEGLPGSADVCFVAVGGGFIDGEADVEVGGLVGVFIVELKGLALSGWKKRR